MMMRLVEWIGKPLSIDNPMSEADWCRCFINEVKGCVESCSESYRQGYYEYLQEHLIQACGHGWASGCKYRDRIKSLLTGMTIVSDTRAFELFFCTSEKVEDFLYQIQGRNDSEVALIVVKLVKQGHIVNGLQRSPMHEILHSKGYIQGDKENWRKHISKWETFLQVKPE